MYVCCNKTYTLLRDHLKTRGSKIYVMTPYRCWGHGSNSYDEHVP